MNFTTVITVNGTKRSERANGLDDGECSTFTIRPGEYDRNLQRADDLIAQIEHSAFTRGEWISSLSIDGVDFVERAIQDMLREHHGSAEIALQALVEMAMFCNASGDDLLPLVLRFQANRDAA